jgi:glucuronate isomerase
MDDIAQAYERVYGIKAKVVAKGSAKELYDEMWDVRNQPSSQPHQYMAMSVEVIVFSSLNS